MKGGMTRIRCSLEPDQKIAFLSDLHLGGGHTDMGLLKAHLELVRQHNARFVLGGDIFDLILARDSKRYKPSALHPALRGSDNIVGKSLDLAEELLAPYGDLLDVICDGNHETKVLMHHSVDVIEELVHRLQARGSKVRKGGYVTQIEYSLPAAKKNRKASPFRIFFWHDAGGGCSLASAARKLEAKLYVQNADLIWMGHKHLPLCSRMELPCCATGTMRPIWLLRTGGYVRPYQQLSDSGEQLSYVVENLINQGSCPLSLLDPSPLNTSITFLS